MHPDHRWTQSPDDGAHALRILRSYKSGEKLNSAGAAPAQAADARGRRMPERPEFGDNIMAVDDGADDARRCRARRRSLPLPPGAPAWRRRHTRLSLTESGGMAVNSPPCAAVRLHTTNFPEELIAQQPLAERSASRSADARRRHRRARPTGRCRELAAFVARRRSAGASTTRRVIPARLFALKESGGKVGAAARAAARRAALVHRARGSKPLRAG